MALKNRQYPHMLPEEIPIWERYLDKHKNEWEHFQYDVHVGTPVIVPEGIPENIKEDAERLSLKRIDVVGWKAGKPTVIEIKHVCGLKALGQAIAYPILLGEQLKASELPEVLIVAETLTTDIDRILNMMEIPYIVV